MFRKLVVAFDHRVDVKYINRIRAHLSERGAEAIVIEDAGAANDYPLLARAAYCEFVSKKADGLVLLCGTGVGMNIVANKCNGVRSVLPDCEATAYFARRDEDANCIVFAAGKSDENYQVKFCARKMIRMLDVFLNTKFLGEERHARRISQITDIERGKL